jgi:hypothetical protein
MDDQVHFELVRENESWPFDGVIVGGRVQGCIELRDRLTLAWLERTRLASMRSVQPAAPVAGWASFDAAQRAEEPKELVKQFQEFAEHQPESPLAFDALRGALRMSRRAELTEEQLQLLAERYLELSKLWGKRWSENTVESIAADLATADGPQNASADAMALQFAESARAALRDDALTSRKQAVDLAYAVALVRNDRAEEGKKLLDELIARAPDEGELRFYAAHAAEKLADMDGAFELLVPLWPHPLAAREMERIWQEKNGSLDGLEERLDEIYWNRFPPIPTESYAGRETPDANQTAVAELFTGTSCQPCVAADVAFEALGRTFKPSELVLLQYHLHVPGPDPLTNADAVERAKYYKVPGTPLLLVNGQESGQGGGARQHGPDRYTEYRTDIEKQLERKTDAKLMLSATRAEDEIAIDVNLSDVSEPGEKLRLRLAVVEEIVRFNGRNGVRLHHAVVRALPGGAEGIAVTESSLTHHATVNVAELRESLSRELSEFEKQVSEVNKVSFEFPAKPLELKQLQVVAFLQDDATQSILQAAFVEPSDGSK